jgi:hypothetical protein
MSSEDRCAEPWTEMIGQVRCIVRFGGSLQRVVIRTGGRLVFVLPFRNRILRRFRGIPAKLR